MFLEHGLQMNKLKIEAAQSAQNHIQVAIFCYQVALEERVYKFNILVNHSELNQAFHSPIIMEIKRLCYMVSLCFEGFL